MARIVQVVHVKVTTVIEGQHHGPSKIRGLPRSVQHIEQTVQRHYLAAFPMQGAQVVTQSHVIVVRVVVAADVL
jgi:hypothetical protein